MTRKIKNIINHWSASASTTTVDDIRRWHKGRGWRDIGYHRIILHPNSDEFIGKDKPEEWFDLVKQGRPINDDEFLEEKEMGAHAYGFNRDTFAICTVLMPGQSLHPLQVEAWIETNKTWKQRAKLNNKAVIGHRKVSKTQCPGNEIMGLIEEFRSGKFDIIEREVNRSIIVLDTLEGVLGKMQNDLDVCTRLLKEIRENE